LRWWYVREREREREREEVSPENVPDQRPFFFRLSYVGLIPLSRLRRFLSQDYKGQKLSEILYQLIILVFSLLSFIAGYQTQSFSNAFYGWLAGTVLAAVVCIPDWPFFNQFPTKFLDDIPDPPRSNSGRKKKSDTRSKGKRR